MLRSQSRISLGLSLALVAGLGVISPRSCSADEGQVYQVGVARVDVTPRYPIRLNGFGGRREESEGVTQRIWAKALAIGADEEKPVILITLDSLGIREPMVDEVARRLKEKARIQRDRIAVTFTHSHTTPKVVGACDTIFSSPIPPEHQAHIEQYTAELTDAIEKVALDALASRQPSRLSWSVGKVGFAMNRRTEGGPVDHDLPMLVVKSADNGELRAVYVTYACHCVTLSDNKISGDWAGFAQEAIERTHPGVTALVSIGCGSDSNPNSGVTGSNTAAAADQGDQVRTEVDRLLTGALKPISGQVFATLSHIDLPLRELPSREQLEALAARGGAEGYNVQYQLARLDRGEPLVSKLKYPVQTIALGDSLAMVFLAGEVCVDYSLRLKEEFPEGKLWMHGYSNDFCAYIPSERLLKEGGYGGGGEIHYFALPATLAPGLEEKIIAEVHRQVPQPFKRQAREAAQAKVREEKIAAALALIEVHEDLIVEVAAAEPLIADPVAIDFGPDGRLWVAEMPDYTRFVDEEFPQNGNIRVLTDADQDGRYDASQVFVDGLRFPTDVKSWRKGVIVCDAPEVIYLEDSDGDGKADVRKVLLTGFETHNAQARVNSLRWGLDGWLYGSGGLFGGNIRTFTGLEVRIGERDFRFRPDTGELQGVAGRTQQGRARDDWGNWFGCENGVLVDHYPLTDHYLARNPLVSPPPMEVRVHRDPRDSQLHPISTPTMFALSGPPGRPTAACGLEIYRDELLGPDYYGNVFVCEPVNNLVHRAQLVADGATFRGRRAEEESDREFLASTDPWFRPVQVRTGLDGCLYVVDMHRRVIEHPKFIPEADLAQLDLMGGRSEGRIYRVRPRKQAPRTAVKLDHLNEKGLIAAIDSPNGPQRDLAHQLLIARHSKAAGKRLREIALTSRWPAARVQALSALGTLKALDIDLVQQCLADRHPAVRRHAIRLSEPLVNSTPKLIDALAGLVTDADPQVKLQLAYTLGAVPGDRSAKGLAMLALAGRSDAYLVAAVWSSATSANVGPLVRCLLADKSIQPPPELLDVGVNLLIKLGSPSEIQTTAIEIAANESIPTDVKLEAVARLLSWAAASDDRSAAVVQQLTPIVAQAESILARDNAEPTEVLAAIQVIAASASSTESLVELLVPLIEPRQPPAVQQAAVRSLMATARPEAVSAVLSAWRSYAPETRRLVFDLVMGSDEAARSLLSKITAAELAVSDFDAFQRQRLMEHPNETLRDEAKKLLAADSNSSRAEIVARYRESAAGGDRSLGREVFTKHCASCHQLDGVGHVVGPDLAALTTRTTDSLLVSILDPNRDIDERYRSYTALTADGLAHAGILADESSTSITLVEQEGARRTLLRSELEVFENTGKSLMPEGLERDLSPQDMAHLIAYVSLAGLTAKRVEGNAPVEVSPDSDGSLWLMATNCEIYGDSITFEQPLQNIGYWGSAGDHVAWNVHADEPREYEVILHWASTDDTEGGSFVIEGGDPVIEGEVESTGGFHRYKSRRMGTMSLPAGSSRIVVRPAGPVTTGALMDLRGVYLIPLGVSTERAERGDPPTRAQDAADEIASLVKELPVGTPAEYKKIPRIWEIAIAAGRRNQAAELLRLLEQATPLNDQPLHDWQAVVIGGGVVNGLTQSGEWPRRRLDSILAHEPEVRSRFERALKLAAEKADDGRVKAGTRYDALRMLGADSWQNSGQQLVKYLGHDVGHELQMGAVSGLMDMDADQAAAAVITNFPHLHDGNQRLAIEGLLRSPERRRQLQKAIEDGQIPADELKPEERALLVEIR